MEQDEDRDPAQMDQDRVGQDQVDQAVAAQDPVADRVDPRISDEAPSPTGRGLG